VSALSRLAVILAVIGFGGDAIVRKKSSKNCD